MKFKVIIKNKVYYVDIEDAIESWNIQLLEEGLDKKMDYNISKKDFLEFPKAVSFLFKNKSHLLYSSTQGEEKILFCKGSHRNIKVLNEEEMLRESMGSSSNLQNESNIFSAMPGKIVKLYAEIGKSYKKGTTLIVIEAMKMENEIQAPDDVCIKEILVKKNDSVEAGSKLISFQ